MEYLVVILIFISQNEFISHIRLILLLQVFLYFLDDFTAIVRIYLDAGYIFEEGFTPVLVLFVRILECCCADLDVVVFILLFK